MYCVWKKRVIGTRTEWSSHKNYRYETFAEAAAIAAAFLCQLSVVDVAVVPEDFSIGPHAQS